MDSNSRGSLALRLVNARNACAGCEIERLCLPATLPRNETPKLGTLIRPLGPFATGEAVYRRGEAFRGLYVLRRGVLRTEKPTAGGLLDILAFYLEGDIFGMESLGQRNYLLDAIALEDAEVCQLPLDLLEEACRHVPSLQHALFQRLGDALRGSQECGHRLLEHRTEARVLSFFVETFARLERIRPVNPDCFRVPFSKGDIAAHLHMRPETFSRTLVKLARGALLRSLGNGYWSFPDLERAQQVLARSSFE